jgi:predicted O-methyltransferase YrrM
MAKKKWSSVDAYITDKLALHDAALDAAVNANVKAKLPMIDVSPAQGKLLHLLAKMQRARRILEIGTLGGYSTIWLARALPAGGKLVTLEVSPKHARVAKKNLERAGLSKRVEILLGPALESLAKLHARRAAPFDFIFIDADKENIPAYLEGSLKVSRVGTVLVIDNVVRDGAILNPRGADAQVKGVRTMFDMLAAERRLSATAIQTVGAKGWDGFALAVVTSLGAP